MGTGKVLSDIQHKNMIWKICETEQYIFIYHTFNIVDKDKRRQFISLYDKQKRQLTANISREVFNDIDGGIHISPSFPSFQNDTYIYVLLWPFEMKEQLTAAHFTKSKALYPEKQKALQTLVDKLLEDDNPVVMLVKLR
jgi:hypothetical protein